MSGVAKQSLKLSQGCLLAVLLFFSVDAASAAPRSFSIHNTGSLAVYFIQVSPHDSVVWGRDLLGVQALPPGGSYQVDLSEYGEGCGFDIRVEDERGNVREYRNVDLCSVSEVYYP